jgi:ribosomal protein S18 acetylase RimI-like enzyme
MNQQTVRVTYLELREPTLEAPAPVAGARAAVERPDPQEYLTLYRRVGGPVRWDQRLRMPAEELAALLGSDRLRIYVLRDDCGAALGFCEFDRGRFPEVELTNFGLVPAAQGRGLGRWLLAHALYQEWQASPSRLWLHTDSWDHPAALAVYRRAGFAVYAVRDEPPDDL